MEGTLLDRAGSAKKFFLLHGEVDFESFGLRNTG